MALNAQKRQAVPSLAAVVDELGQLEKEFAPLKAKSDRIEALRRQLREAFADKDATADFTVEGRQFSVHLGPRAQAQTVNIAKVYKSVGTKIFLQLVSITLKSLQTHAPTLAHEVVTAGPTGTRPLKISEKAGA